MAINLICENSKCKHNYEYHCMKNINEERLVINNIGQCETFEEGVSEMYSISDAEIADQTIVKGSLCYEETPTLRFICKNWKGVIGTRNVIPQRVYYGSTEFHKEEQWLMITYDLDKQAERIYALKNIIEWL